MHRPTPTPVSAPEGSALSRRIESVRRITRGAGPVTIGVMIAGACTYGFLGITARSVGPEAFSGVSALWSLVFTAGPGVFLPLQQEMGRALASRPGPRGATGILRDAALLAGGLAVVAGVMTALAGPWLVEHALGGSWLLFLALELSIAGFATSYLVRGLLSGVGQFTAFARVVAGEAVVRLLLASVFAVVGVRSPVPYGMAIAVAPLISVAALLLWRRPPPIPEGPPIPRRALRRSLSYLLAGSVLAQVLANAGPIVVEALASDEDGPQAGRFLAALVVARLALFLFQAVQAALVPNLASMATTGRLAEFKSAVRHMVAVIGALTVAGGAGAALLGPTVVEVLFGEGFPVSSRTMATLTGASMLYVLALALSGALIALERQAQSAMIWAVGVAVFAGGLFVTTDLYLRVEIGYLAGSGVAAALQLAVVVRSARARAREPRAVPADEPALSV